MSCSTRALESGPAVLCRDEDTANKDGCKGSPHSSKMSEPSILPEFGFLWFWVFMARQKPRALAIRPLQSAVSVSKELPHASS